MAVTVVPAGGQADMQFAEGTDFEVGNGHLVVVDGRRRALGMFAAGHWAFAYISDQAEGGGLPEVEVGAL